MKGFTAPLWPIRYNPYPDELLSSWLMRLARGHGLKAQTFCNIVFGSRHQVWNRDIDRLGPEWILKEISARTGKSFDTALGTTLRAYEGWLYPKSKDSGPLQWIQTLKVYHRKRQGFGLQFCSECLRECPYYRKSWRVTFNTICLRHQCMLCDRCPKCGAAVAFHRRDMGRLPSMRSDSMARCHNCEFDLTRVTPEPIGRYDVDAGDWHAGLCRQLCEGRLDQSVDLGIFTVMRQLAKLLTSRYSTIQLHAHVCSRLGIMPMGMALGRVPIESRVLNERHHLMQLIAWLMLDLEPRLRDAWRTKAVRYNQLLKDFDDAPAWYQDVVEGFSDWRGR